MNNKTLEEAINYTFKSKGLLENALVHSSYASESEDVKSNERLEFLGDAVLGVVVGEALFKTYADLPEGKLSTMRAYIVCEKSLATAAISLNLGEYLKFGIGEQRAGGKKKPSILADAVEALIGAIFLDSDYDSAKKVVLSLLHDKILKAGKTNDFDDYKSKLQVKIQKSGNERIEYRLDGTAGKPNNREFFVSLLVNGKKISEGTGLKKKEAEQAAAKAALERID